MSIVYRYIVCRYIVYRYIVYRYIVYRYRVYRYRVYRYRAYRDIRTKYLYTSALKKNRNNQYKVSSAIHDPFQLPSGDR